jgi:hypothetical protein
LPSRGSLKRPFARTSPAWALWRNTHDWHSFIIPPIRRRGDSGHNFGFHKHLRTCGPCRGDGL